MTEEIKIDKDYLDAFNLGYELAKELNLKSPIIKDLNSDSSRMYALQTGMAEYSKEIVQGKRKEIIQSIDSVINKPTDRLRESNEDTVRDKDKGLNLSL